MSPNHICHCQPNNRLRKGLDLAQEHRRDSRTTQALPSLVAYCHGVMEFARVGNYVDRGPTDLDNAGMSTEANHLSAVGVADRPSSY